MNGIELDEFLSLADNGYVVVDVRQPQIFSQGFLKDAISISNQENFIHVFHELIESDWKVLLIADENEIPFLSKKISSAGITIMHAFLKGEFEPSKIPVKYLDMLITIDAEELRLDYRFDEFYLVDVRSKEEFEIEHLEHAENITLNDLEQLIIDLDIMQSYYVYAGSVAEAVTAGSLFKRYGFNRVKVVTDSFDIIKATGISVVRNKKEKSSEKFLKN